MHVQAQVVLGAPSKKGHVPSSPKGLQAVWLRLPEQVRSFLHDLQVIGIVATWCVVVMTGIFTPLLIVLFFPHRFAILWAAVLAILSLWPLEDSIVLPAARFICGVCVKAAIRYFPVEVYVEHADELRPGTPYIVGYEPHSVIPNGMPVVFSEYSRLLPAGLRGITGLASSTCFHVPIIRHLWWGLGLRPATRKVMSQTLARGQSVVICPGGVKECCHLSYDKEVIFLRQRYGFVRMALEHGAPLVPAFCFGQTGTFHWIRPGPPFFSEAVVTWVASKLGFLPVYVYGYGFLPMPLRTRMRVVIGRAIAVPKVEKPSHALIEEYLQRFIASMADLYDRHCKAAGCQDRKLEIL
eukprot:jgi/Botrbrau1/19836/Bobra.0124s0073.1